MFGHLRRRPTQKIVLNLHLPSGWRRDAPFSLSRCRFSVRLSRSGPPSWSGPILDQNEHLYFYRDQELLIV